MKAYVIDRKNLAALVATGLIFGCCPSAVDAFHSSSQLLPRISSPQLCKDRTSKSPQQNSVISECETGVVCRIGSTSLREQSNAESSKGKFANLDISRRTWLSRVSRDLGIVTAATCLATTGGPPADAIQSNVGEVTDKVFVDISGLSTSASAEISKTQRIVIGLFGKDAPESVQKLQQLHSPTGLAAQCKALKEDFLIQREQLEANKVYRSCTETQDKGVTYEYAQIWRIIKNDRIDFGSLSGKFVAREFPTWEENMGSGKSPSDYLSSTDIGNYLVAVRKGSESGFGYTIFPTMYASSNQDFLENYLVVGKIVEGEDVVSKINDVSVVNSAKVNYMAIVGGGGSKSNAPNRSCRYGGPMYCNENKPLTKLTMFRTGKL